MPSIRRYGPDSEPRINPPDEPVIRPVRDPYLLTSEECAYLIELVTKRPPGYFSATKLVEKLYLMHDDALDFE